MSRFEIPLRFQDRLEICIPHDQRSDGEILRNLIQHTPVTSEKNIWAFWHTGILSMPGWCRRNVVDWVRICSPSWAVRVLDNVPQSPNYALNYLDPKNFPRAFVERTMDGPYVGQHSADLVRGAVLSQYGGVWMDVGSILTRHLDRVCWDRIQDSNDPYQVAVTVQPSHGILNYFVACRKGDRFIRRWHEIFYALWEGRTNLLGISDHPLVSFIKQVPPEQLKAEENEIGFDYKVSMVKVFEYAVQIIAWARLAMLEPNAVDGFSYADYWMNNIMRIDAIKEAWRAETILGFGVGGQSKLDVLTTSLDADRESEQYKRAEEVVWLILSESSMQKVCRGKNLSFSVQLGTMLDLPENSGRDYAPGTFAELLRYGTVHFRQKRSHVLTRVSTGPEARTTLNKEPTPGQSG